MHSKSLSLMMCVALSACGSESRVPGGAFADYEEENVTVIGGDDQSAAGEERITVSSPKGEGECVEVSSNLCVPAEASSDWCDGEGGPVDIVVVDGEVVEVVCYPPPGNDEKPEEVIGTDHQGNVELVQNANRTAVVFDETTDGVPIEGDIDIEGNGVSIYGNGPDNTIIEGDVIVSGNRARLRGITITGDLDLSKNNVSVVLCRVLGNVILSSASTNGSVFVENDVFGNFISDSNGNTLTGNDVMGTWTVTGNNNVCDADFLFADSNQNEMVDEGERGDALVCPSN